MADTIVTLGADLSQFRREMAKLPNMSADAAQKTLIGIEKLVRQVEVEAKKAGKKITNDQKKQAREAERAFQKQRTGAEKVFGGIVGDVLDVGEAIGTLGPAAVAASVGFLAIAGTVVGIAAVGGAILAITSAAGELLEELDEIGQTDFLSDETRGELDAMADAFTAIGVASKQLHVLLAGELSEGTTAFLHGMIGLTAVIAENWDTIAKVSGAALESILFQLRLVAAMSTMGMSELTLWIARQTGLTAAVGETTEALVEKGEQVTKNIKITIEAAKAEKKQADAAKDAAKDAVEALREVEKVREKAAGHLVEDDSFTVWAIKQMDALDELERANLDNWGILVQVYAARIALIEAVDRAVIDAAANRAEIDRKERQAAQQQRQEIEALVEWAEDQAGALTLTQGQMVASVVAAAADAINETTGELAGGISALGMALAESGSLGKEAALRAFKTARAASLAQVAIQTAAGIARQFAELPFPAALVTSASVAATGAAQAITIAHQQPPEFFAGGLLQAAPDTVPFFAHSGERVTVETAASRRRETGGDLRARNSGAGDGGPLRIDVMYGGRVLDTIFTEEARRPASGLRRTMGTGRQGQRRQRRG